MTSKETHVYTLDAKKLAEGLEGLVREIERSISSSYINGSEYDLLEAKLSIIKTILDSIICTSTLEVEPNYDNVVEMKKNHEK